MAHAPRARREERPPGRADGLTIAPAPGGRKTLLLLAAAGALAAVALLSLFGPRRTEPAPPPDPPVAVRRAAPVAASPRVEVHAVRAPAAAPPTPAKDTASAEAPRPAPDVIPMPIAPIAPSGIGVFPPPGTDPPKIGIIVPEGFELPEGYVRHYQVTDDGQALPPILMFHPDYDWVDATGAHVEATGNGVVPPELAPPGMPIEMLELPESPSEP